MPHRPPGGGEFPDQEEAAAVLGLGRYAGSGGRGAPVVSSSWTDTLIRSLPTVALRVSSGTFVWRWTFETTSETSSRAVSASAEWPLASSSPATMSRATFTVSGMFGARSS
ncbi:hypothetical protein ACGRHY_17905 [Streptomyces sp. HK10]|uniref:hypothetical protein n=1 Tax=Streptomyces sp. HK10 TaxID=3373255 RepID=UPI00374A360C